MCACIPTFSLSNHSIGPETMFMYVGLCARRSKIWMFFSLSFSSHTYHLTPQVTMVQMDSRLPLETFEKVLELAVAGAKYVSCSALAVIYSLLLSYFFSPTVACVLLMRARTPNCFSQTLLLSCLSFPLYLRLILRMRRAPQSLGCTL